jgi:hypothetical protein
VYVLWIEFWGVVFMKVVLRVELDVTPFSEFEARFKELLIELHNAGVVKGCSFGEVEPVASRFKLGGIVP